MALPDPAAIGRYEVVSRLGQGGMGALYLAKDPKIGRLVAIKLVRQEFDSPDARQRFAREAQSAGTLRHPNIVTIFDVDEHEGLPFIAMEYIDGETLGEIIKILTQNNGIKLTNAPRRTVYRMHKGGGQWRMLAPSTPMPKPPSSSQ